MQEQEMQKLPFEKDQKAHQSFAQAIQKSQILQKTCHQSLWKQTNWILQDLPKNLPQVLQKPTQREECCLLLEEESQRSSQEPQERHRRSKKRIESSMRGTILHSHQRKTSTQTQTQT